MSSRTFLTLVRLALVLVLALCWGAGVANAQKKGSTPQAAGQKTITDAAGRVHVRPTARISDAQRKAVAQRMKAARIAALKNKKSEVKK